MIGIDLVYLFLSNLTIKKDYPVLFYVSNSERDELGSTYSIEFFMIKSKVYDINPAVYLFLLPCIPPLL
ncbi:hypothetical protein EB008_02670 [bacterium]|nr:hypothetical protein [bacterium]